MEEINLKELFDYFKERIFIILSIILVFVLAGALYSTFLKTPLYKSTSNLLLISDGGSNNTITQQDLVMNKNLISTYSALVKSRTVMKNVIANLDLKITTDQLAGMVNVANVADTDIIEISVVDKDRKRAAIITNELVKEFSKSVKVHYKLSNVSVVDAAEEAHKPYNINFIKDLIIYLLIGTVLAFGTVFVIFYFDTTIKSADDVENKLGLPVLGVVPKIDGSK